MASGQFQQPSRFCEVLPSLYGDTSMKAIPFQLRLQIFRHEIAAKRLHRIIDPAVFARVVPPEMLVGVDVHHKGLTAPESVLWGGCSNRNRPQPVPSCESRPPHL